MRRLQALSARRSKKRSVNMRAKKLRSFLFDKRAVSVALSTLIISAGVVAAGIAVLYWARSWGAIADQQYSNSVAQSQAAISERIAFEYIAYSKFNSTLGTLSVFIINCGLSNNVSIARMYIWNSQSVPIGTFPVSPQTSLTLYNITSNSAIPNSQGLSVGNDGYFNVTMASPGPSGLFSTSSGSFYIVRVVTASGRNYDGSFSIP